MMNYEVYRSVALLTILPVNTAQVKLDIFSISLSQQRGLARRTQGNRKPAGEKLILA